MKYGFKGYHPLINVLFFISVITFGMFFNHPVCLVTSLVASTVYYLKLSGSIGRKTVFGFLIPMLFVVVIINSFFNHYGVTTLFTLPSGNRFTFESLVSGFVTAFMAISVIEWFFCFNEVVTEDKFVHIFGKVLPKGALVLSMVLRFVPLYRQRYREISQARQGIGKSIKSSNFILQIKDACKNLGILISWSFENAIETADSMKSRGYGLKGKTYYSRFRWQANDTFALLTMIIFDIIIAFCAVAGAGYCIYNPYLIINAPSSSGTTYIINELNITVNPFTASGTTMFIIYTILCFLPIIIDVKEDIKWNRLKSKI